MQFRPCRLNAQCHKPPRCLPQPPFSERLRRFSIFSTISARCSGVSVAWNFEKLLANFGNLALNCSKLPVNTASKFFYISGLAFHLR